MIRLTELFSGSSALALAVFLAAQLFPASPEVVSSEPLHPAVERVIVGDVRVAAAPSRDHDLERLRERSPFASLAARNLAAEGDRRAVPVLAALLRSPPAGRRVDDVMLRHACIDALRSFGGPEALRALEDTAAEPAYESLAASAAAALRRVAAQPLS